MDAHIPLSCNLRTSFIKLTTVNPVSGGVTNVIELFTIRIHFRFGRLSSSLKLKEKKRKEKLS